MGPPRCIEVNRLGARCLATARSGDVRCPLHAAVDPEQVDPPADHLDVVVIDPP
jgi:hypothetical protein